MCRPDLISSPQTAAREAGKGDTDFPSLLMARGRGLRKEFCWPLTVPAPCGSTRTHPSLPSHSPHHSYSGCCLGVCCRPPQLPHLWTGYTAPCLSTEPRGCRQVGLGSDSGFPAVRPWAVKHRSVQWRCYQCLPHGATLRLNDMMLLRHLAQCLAKKMYLFIH